jgi:hypothetical protein
LASDRHGGCRFRLQYETSIGEKTNGSRNGAACVRKPKTCLRFTLARWFGKPGRRSSRQSRKEFPAYIVDADVDPLAAGQGLHSLTYVIGGIVDDGVGAMVANDIRLSGSAHRRDNACAQQPGHLHTGQADAAGRASDEDGLAGPDLRTVDERVMGREIHMQEGGAYDKTHAVGQARRFGLLRGHSLRESAVPGLAGDPIARLKAADLFTNGHDNSGCICAGHIRKRRA